MLATFCPTCGAAGSTAVRHQPVFKTKNSTTKPYAAQLLEAVGFHADDGSLRLAADAELGPLVAALSRLRRLADNKVAAVLSAHKRAPQMMYNMCSAPP